MNSIALPTTPSAAAHAPARSTLELLEARQLRDALTTLLHREQAAMADFLVALADFDRRRGWESLGHASLFAFLTVELHLSRSAAFWRLSAARLLQRFPQIIEPLRDGRLCLSTTAELAKVLTSENLVETLPRYFRLSAREAAEVTAALLPREQPPIRTVVTTLWPDQGSMERAGAPEEMVVAATAGGAARTPGTVLTSEPTSVQPARGSSPREDVEPLTADLRRLHVTVSRAFLAKVEAARRGLSRSLPGATTEQVLEAALDQLLARQAKARGQVKRPRAKLPSAQPAPEGDAATGAPRQEASTLALVPAGPTPARRSGPREAIPAAVRRAVWERDQGRCQWPLDSGGCCGSAHQLELDHLVPWARGGPPTVDGLRLLCHAHNALAARQAFGSRCVGRYASGQTAR
jgi:hypothetical protein